MLTRPRLLLLVAGLACAGLAARLALPDGACTTRATPAPPVIVVRADKPAGPVVVQLAPAEPAARGQRVQVLLRPVRTLTAVTWRWELSGGVVLAEGAASGTADPHAGAVSAFEVLLLPPPGGAPGLATLVAEATFPGAADTGPTGPEVALQSAGLRWGELPDAPVPVLPGVDAETGEPTFFAVLPSGHRPGR